MVSAENAWEDYAILEEMVGLLKDPDTAFVSALSLEFGARRRPELRRHRDPRRHRVRGHARARVCGCCTSSRAARRWLPASHPGTSSSRSGMTRARDRTWSAGPVDSDVSLLVQSPGQEPRTVVVSRQQIAPTYEPTATRLAGCPGIGYLRLLSLAGEDVPAAVTTALTGLLDAGPLDGLVLDLRHTSQGAPGVTTSVLGQFVGGDVGSIVTHGGTDPVRGRGRRAARPAQGRRRWRSWSMRRPMGRRSAWRPSSRRRVVRSSSASGHPGTRSSSSRCRCRMARCSRWWSAV